MLSLDERLATMEVTVSTPNEQVYGRIDGRTPEGVERLWVGFRQGCVETESVAELERQIESLGRLLFAARMMRYYKLLTEITGEPRRGPRQPRSPRHAAYQEALQDLVCEGSSPDGLVTVRSANLAQWSVHIDRGRPMPDPTSLGEAVARAGEAMIADYRRQMLALKREILW